jgi:hypothetical protein
MISLTPEVKKVLDESYEQRFKKEKHAVKLDCWRNHKYLEPTIVEVDRVQDQLVTCPLCGRRQLITFRKVI